MTDAKSMTPANRELLNLCCVALDDTKAEDLQILDVSIQSSITNFMILATANSEPHLRALKRDLGQALKDKKVKILGTEDGQDSGWSVVDAFDVMIHLFTPETRETYALETLWKDAGKIDLSQILTG